MKTKQQQLGSPNLVNRDKKIKTWATLAREGRQLGARSKTMESTPMLLAIKK